MGLPSVEFALKQHLSTQSYSIHRIKEAMVENIYAKNISTCQVYIVVFSIFNYLESLLLQ